MISKEDLARLHSEILTPYWHKGAQKHLVMSLERVDELLARGSAFRGLSE